MTPKNAPSLRRVTQRHCSADALTAPKNALLQSEEARQTARINDSHDIYKYVYRTFSGLDHEEFHVLLLNQRNRVLGMKQIGVGGLTYTVADVRVILREALLMKATTIVLCHNHPNGSTEPSRDDNEVTRHVKESSRLMQIRLLDHLIFTEDGYYSYADWGTL